MQITRSQSSIVKNSLSKPEQFERSAANARSAQPFISRVSGCNGRDDITGVHHESPSCSKLCLGALAFCSSAEAKALQHGITSCYGPGLHGRRTANGEKFNTRALTAAHKSLPFG